MLNTLITIMMVAMMGGHSPMMRKMGRMIYMEMGINALVEDASVQKQLGLSTTQVNKIRELKFGTDKNIIKQRSNMELKETDLRAELSKDNPDMTRVEKLIKDKHAIMAEIELAKVKEYTSIKKILKPEQIEELKAIMRKRGRNMMKMRQKMAPQKKGIR